MAEHTLTRDMILDAAEDTLRRFGPAKTTVVDVARALGVSHGTVYRHFPSKADLRDAVIERWLHSVSGALEPIVESTSPAPERLRRWVETLVGIKQAWRASSDRELFETYSSLFDDARAVIDQHVEILKDQLSHIIAEGIAEGSFAPTDARVAAFAVLQATAAFHVPAMAANWGDADIGSMLNAVLDIVLAGLQAR